MSIENDSSRQPVIGTCYFFGCHRNPGHFLWTQEAQLAEFSVRKECLPFRFDILDAGLLPTRKGEAEGKGTIVHWPNFTVVSFWDRSVDSRFGSNSAFIIPAVLNFEEAIKISKERFPWVWERIKFEVSLF